MSSGYTRTSGSLSFTISRGNVASTSSLDSTSRTSSVGSSQASSLAPSSSAPRSSATSFQSQTSIAASTASLTDVLKTENKSSSLSTGAIAGVAIGCTLGGLALTIAAFFLLRRHKKNKEIAAGTMPNGRDDTKEVTTSDRLLGQDQDRDHKADGNGVYQLDGRTRAHELDGPEKHNIPELEATRLKRYEGG